MTHEVAEAVARSEADTPALLIEGARKAYGRSAVGRAEAVSDVSLAVSKGAIHGLLGPNGAGKTTTLKMLLGLVRPSGGRFEILGVAAHAPGARARLGFLPEQPYFPAQLTAGEVLEFHGRLANLDRSRIAAQLLYTEDKVANRTEILEHINRTLEPSALWLDDDERFEGYILTARMLETMGFPEDAAKIDAVLERMKDAGLGQGDHDHDGDGTQDH